MYSYIKFESLSMISPSCTHNTPPATACNYMTEAMGKKEIMICPFYGPKESF